MANAIWFQNRQYVWSYYTFSRAINLRMKGQVIKCIIVSAAFYKKRAASLPGPDIAFVNAKKAPRSSNFLTLSLSYTTKNISGVSPEFIMDMHWLIP